MNIATPDDPELVAMILDVAMRYNGMDKTTQRSFVEYLRHGESPVSEQLHH